LGFGFWVLGFGFWVLGFGFWVLGFGFWFLGFGFWVLGWGLVFGVWCVVRGVGVHRLNITLAAMKTTEFATTCTTVESRAGASHHAFTNHSRLPTPNPKPYSK
jgi:hypothetical protein